MFAYFNGTVAELDAAQAVVECNGVGYALRISLQTYDALKCAKQAKLYAYLQVREDAQILYGFATLQEKDLFETLISVSGVGGNTALTLLSGLSPTQIAQAISTEQPAVFEQIKGIGKKTAARLVLELKDKVGKLGGENTGGGATTFIPPSRVRTEGLAALVSLGFPKAAMEKKVDELLAKQPDLKVEDLIKAALKS